MKIAVIGSNGKAGHAIIKEAMSRNLDVTGFSRGDNKHPSINFVKKNLFDLTSEDLEGYDVIINAFGTWRPETLHLHKVSLDFLAQLLANSTQRLITVGGAGSLYLDDSMTTQLKDSPDFPDDYRPLAAAMSEGLELLKTLDKVNWTYISPAMIFDSNGKRTGSYEIAGEVLKFNEEGKSYISYADYAIAVIDEALNNNYPNQRISVYTK